MKRIPLIVAVSLLACMHAFAGQLSKEGTKAFAALRKVDYFAVGGVGFAGRMSDGEHHLRTLLKDPQAKSQLKLLLNDKNIATRLYALLALKSLDAKSVPNPQIVKTMFDGKVGYMSGCLMDSKHSAYDLAQQILKDQIRLSVDEPAKS